MQRASRKEDRKCKKSLMNSQFSTKQGETMRKMELRATQFGGKLFLFRGGRRGQLDGVLQTRTGVSGREKQDRKYARSRGEYVTMAKNTAEEKRKTRGPSESPFRRKKEKNRKRPFSSIRQRGSRPPSFFHFFLLLYPGKRGHLN